MNNPDVRRAIYDLTVRYGNTPPAREVAAELGATESEVVDAFKRLASERIIVLDATDNILMAAPFSGIPTSFTVRVADKSYYANCIWDALGVSPMLQQDSTISTTCPDCDEPLELRVENGALTGDGIVHFSVPARQWWNDILYT